MDKTKRGIALFITLLVIASILSIVAVSFSYLEKVRKDAGRMSAIIQGNLFYKNTTDILKRFFPKDKADSKKLDMIYNMPLMLSEPKSGFNINLQCKPLMVGVPIKWLDESFTKKHPSRLDLARDVLSEIIEKYEIAEPNRLEELIFAEIAGTDREDSEYEKRLKEKKGIVSKKQFDRVILNYRLRYDDDKVFKIPWERYFVFVDVAKDATIDGAYITAELISVAFDIPLESVQDVWLVDKEMDEKKMTLVEYLAQNASGEVINKKLFSQKALNAMHCEERYYYRNSYYSFSFDYSKERSTNFEFNGEL
ncbi:hypothetical protein GSY74_03375 [Sulfurovum sp. bin170]|uniref:hypothetical protein n=1 Tax=Sulfurovum sp. bin170 TaxID=2695268 RepID=UPI0013DFE9CE|nr:hypothetical protein [Sulfurovum sp. bin170]NEW60314.1 hypothetical protein [Sulfurovum sp. bin170]